MRLRGISFAPVVEIGETLTLGGDAAPRARGVSRLGAGVMLSDGRASRRTLGEYLASGIPETETRPFFLAFRPTGERSAARVAETRAAASLLAAALPGFSAPCALVLDLSLLSSEDPAAFLAEAEAHLAALGGFSAPVVLSVSLRCPPETAASALAHPAADGLLVADSIAWSDLPPNARKVFFRRKVSPLEKIGGGMVSGKYLLPLAAEWVRQLRRQFAAKPVIAGGVLRPRDADALKEAGASGILLGSAARKLRPWNVGRIARRARAVFG